MKNRQSSYTLFKLHSEFFLGLPNENSLLVIFSAEFFHVSACDDAVYGMGVACHEWCLSAFLGVLL